jgi:hypothetical protein
MCAARFLTSLISIYFTGQKQADAPSFRFNPGNLEPAAFFKNQAIIEIGK